MNFVLNYNLLNPSIARTIFKNNGIIYIRNTGMTDLQDMKTVINLFTNDSIEYNSNVPLNTEILFHHEMECVNKSPGTIAFACQKAIENKGWTYVSDQIELTRDLMNLEFGEKLYRKGIIYKRILMDRNIHDSKNNWQSFFVTNSKKEAEMIANEQGLEVEWKDNKMITLYKQDAFEYCPHTKT